MLTHPLAVPEKRFGLSRILAFFDRCAIRVSLIPPPAALGADAHIGPHLFVPDPPFMRKKTASEGMRSFRILFCFYLPFFSRRMASAAARAQVTARP